MTDAPETPVTPENPQTPAEAPGTAASPARPPRAPGAAAASRARRIGGRPVPRPASGAPTASEPAAPVEPAVAEPAPAAAESPQAEPAARPSLTKTAPAPAEEPAGTLPIGDGAAPTVPRWLNWAPAGVLLAGCVVMAVLLLIFSHGVWWGPPKDAAPAHSSVDQRREQVLAAAKSCVVAANDYDYRSLAAYEKRALGCTTGQLTAKLQRTIESLIMKNAPQIKAKQTTQINRGGIESVTPDGSQWTLLVFGQLSVVNANYPKGRTDPFGAEVRMERAHGAWVMSDLTVVSSPLQNS